MISGSGLSFSFSRESLNHVKVFFQRHLLALTIIILFFISSACFILFYFNRLGLAYNDARSHLDIGRRVVEGLKPGLAQLGSVWLPLPHLLMVPTIWNNFMWHSGLSGAIVSMISFVGTGVLIYLFLQHLQVNLWGRMFGVLVFVANWNILYMQSTAMTELLLLGSLTAGVYFLLLWQKNETLIYLLLSAFWIMLATLNRYDGWFLLGVAAIIIGFITWRRKGYKAAEGTVLLFVTLAGFGIFLWFLWNLMIFKDPLYFIFGPYSAHAQQQQLADSGNLATKKDLFLSLKVYWYAMLYNMGVVPVILSGIGALVFFWDKRVTSSVKLIGLALLSPFVFNVLSLYLGFSVVYVHGISGNTWFNVRYGIMMAPTVAIFIGYLISKLSKARYLIIGLLLLTMTISLVTGDAVTIDDARVGASGKNVVEVSGWLEKHTTNVPGFILISVASHDAIIFSSGLPMSKFIHEGTGRYWDLATTHPDQWARWIVVRTYDNNDLTYRLIGHNKAFLTKYTLMTHYPFADVYQIKPQYLGQLQTKAVLPPQD
jgi:hypothetical protein